jgi:hypothetical protein
LVVRTCNYGPCANGYCPTPYIGGTYGVLNLAGDDYCVTLTSLASENPSAPELVADVLYPQVPPTVCSCTMIYKKYFVQICDNSEPPLIAYQLSTNSTLVANQGVYLTGSIPGLEPCYRVISYEGIQTVVGVVNTITQTFDDCTCS